MMSQAGKTESNFPYRYCLYSQAWNGSGSVSRLYPALFRSSELWWLASICRGERSFASALHFVRGRKPAASMRRIKAASKMVAVGTRITPRPPHRSRRALLTHRAPPSGRTSAHAVLNPHAVRRTAANRTDVVSRPSVRTTAACRLFPSGEALPSTTSAGSCLPLFGRFLGTTASSDFSSAYMLGVRLLPSRAGPAQVRARMRPPRFRAKNFSTCTRSPTARGSSHASHSPWDDVAFSSAE